MKLYKLNQGSIFENLKHFIYLTNEYGVPSAEFVDAFIDQFGKIILNGNFTLTQNQIKQLDELWNDIVKDCINNNVEYKENYNSLFYTVLSTKAVNKIKEDWEQSEWNELNEQDKLELLEQFIIDFDKHIMDGIDMQELYFENTPELIKTDEDGEKYIDIYLKTYKADASGRLYSDSSVLINAGSKIHPEQSSLTKSIKYDRQKYTKDLVSIVDVKYKSVSAAGKFVRGQSTNGFDHWKNSKGSPIDLYRYKSNVQKQESFNEEQPIKLNNTNIDTQGDLNKHKTIQHYKLRESEFCQSKIGKTLNYNGENFANIVSNTQIKVNEQTYDIGEYIANNGLDINNIKLGTVIRFMSLYTEYHT